MWACGLLRVLSTVTAILTLLLTVGLECRLEMVRWFTRPLQSFYKTHLMLLGTWTKSLGLLTPAAVASKPHLCKDNDPTHS